MCVLISSGRPFVFAVIPQAPAFGVIHNLSPIIAGQPGHGSGSSQSGSVQLMGKFMRHSTQAGLRLPTLFTSEYFGLFGSLPENFACSMSWIVAEEAEGVGHIFLIS